MLYTVTGQFAKLKKLARLLSVKGEASQEYRYHHTFLQSLEKNRQYFCRCLLLLGDVEGRASLLEKAGQHELANLTRTVHHIKQDNLVKEGQMSDNNEDTRSSAQLLQAPPPLTTLNQPWPLVGKSKSLKNGEVVKEGYRDLAVSSS